MNFTHLSDNDSFSCYHPSVVGYRYFAVVWGSAVTISGTVGNLMTILAFASDPRLRTRFNALMINLALADLLYCTALQPISVDSYAYLHWRGGPLWCQAFGLLLFLSNSVSIITLCLIAVGRYLLIEKRAAFDRIFSNRGLALLLPSTWALGLASFGPLWSVYVFVPEVCTCSFHRTLGRPYTTILLFFYFFLGLGCVGLFYLLIYRRVRVAARALVRYRLSRRSSKRRPPSSVQGTEEGEDSGVASGAADTCSCEPSSQGEIAQNKEGVTWERPPSSHSIQGSVPSSHSADPAGAEECPPALDPASQPAVPAPAVPAPAMPAPAVPAPAMPAPAVPAPAVPASSSTPSSASRDDVEFRRVTRMCFTVFLCFVFCFVPFLMLNIADKHNRAPRVLHMLCANLTWLNSCINPLLYVVMNRQFRQAYRVLLAKAATPFTCLRVW